MEAKFLQAAFLEMNVKEVKGKNHNPRILHYHKFTKLKASTDEIPWCSSFGNFIVIKCGSKGTNSAMARSWQYWGREVEKPIPGCLVVLKRGDNPRYGHVGFYLYETSKNIILIGGNQSDAVSITPYSKTRLVCYRVGK